MGYVGKCGNICCAAYAGFEKGFCPGQIHTQVFLLFGMLWIRTKGRGKPASLIQSDVNNSGQDLSIQDLSISGKFFLDLDIRQPK